MLLVVGVDHAHRLAFSQVAPQVLGKQFGIGADDVVGSAQDGTGGAVVLFQFDDLERGEVEWQLLQVVQRGATPAVDRLVVVADGGETRVRRLAHQQLEHFVLGRIGVLVFVHQHMAQLALPLGAHLGVFAQQAQGQADEVVKVDALVGREPFLVAGHDLRHQACVVVLGLRQGLGGVQSGALPGADGPLPLARGGGVGAATGVFQDAGDVVGIQNAELGLQAQRSAILAQHAHAQGMEGADQHLLGRRPHQFARALAHFGGGLVGEGDGGDGGRLQARLQQARNLVRDDARLARAGAGQYQAGGVQKIDGFLLSQVELDGFGRGHGRSKARRALRVGD